MCHIFQVGKSDAYSNSKTSKICPPFFSPQQQGFSLSQKNILILSSGFYDIKTNTIVYIQVIGQNHFFYNCLAFKIKPLQNIRHRVPYAKILFSIFHRKMKTIIYKPQVFYKFNVFLTKKIFPCNIRKGRKLKNS